MTENCTHARDLELSAGGTGGDTGTSSPVQVAGSFGARVHCLASKAFRRNAEERAVSRADDRPEDEAKLAPTRAGQTLTHHLSASAVLPCLRFPPLLVKSLELHLSIPLNSDYLRVEFGGVLVRLRTRHDDPREDVGCAVLRRRDRRIARCRTSVLVELAPRSTAVPLRATMEHASSRSRCESTERQPAIVCAGLVRCAWAPQRRRDVSDTFSMWWSARVSPEHVDTRRAS